MYSARLFRFVPPRKSIYSIGGSAYDKKLVLEKPFTMYTSNSVRSSSCFGGVAYNIAVNLSKLTSNIHLCSVVGNDETGKDILKSLPQSIIDSQHSLVMDNFRTASYQVVLNRAGEVETAFIEMDIFNQLTINHFTFLKELSNDNSIVFLDTNFSSEVIRHVIEYCKEKNIICCVDPVSVHKSIKLPEDLSGVYLIKPDRFEAQKLSGIQIQSPDDAFSAAERLLKRGVKNCVISLGEQGYILANQEKYTHYKALPVTHVVDATGAGDAFVSGILYGIQQNETLERACFMGAAAAKLTLETLSTVNPNINATILAEVLEEYEDMLRKTTSLPYAANF